MLSRPALILGSGRIDVGSRTRLNCELRASYEQGTAVLCEAREHAALGHFVQVLAAHEVVVGGRALARKPSTVQRVSKTAFACPNYTHSGTILLGLLRKRTSRQKAVQGSR